MSTDNRKKKKELKETRLVHNDNATPNNFWTDVSLAAQILIPLAFLAIIFTKKIPVYPLQGYIIGLWPSVNQQQRLLKWLTARIPYMSNTPKKISQYWKDGSLLCTLINTVVPGACSNPQKHWKKPPTHAQALAYKYLGIPPVLTSLDFAENLDKKSENRFISYLYTLQETINKLTVDPSTLHFTNKYIARGMGLIIGEQNKMSTFYIYPNADTNKLENIFINIKGPYASFGKEIISAGAMTKNMRKFIKQRADSAKERQKLAYKGRSQRYLFRSLSFDLGPLMELWTKTKSGDINIKVDIEPDRAKVEFLPTHSGVYELLLTTNGEHLRGSPFVIRVTKRLSEIALLDLKPKTGRRIISKSIPDFIDETVDITDTNVMFLKLDQNNNKSVKDNLQNEEIEYIEIVQKATMKEVMYNGEIGDNIANARRDNREREFEKLVRKTLDEAEKDIRETSGDVQEFDWKKWDEFDVPDNVNDRPDGVRDIPDEFNDTPEELKDLEVTGTDSGELESLNQELKMAQKKMEERFSLMEEKCGELESLKNDIVNHIQTHDTTEKEGTKSEGGNVSSSPKQQISLKQQTSTRQNTIILSDLPQAEDTVILQSFEIDPYSEEEREFERLYKESLYSNIQPDDEVKTDSYPITDSESYIFEKPVKESKHSEGSKNFDESKNPEDSKNSEDSKNPEESQNSEDSKNSDESKNTEVSEIITTEEECTISNETNETTDIAESLLEEETLMAKASEGDHTSSIQDVSNMTLMDESDQEIIEEQVRSDDDICSEEDTTQDSDDDFVKINKDLTCFKEGEYPPQEFELNTVLVQKDSGYVSNGSAKSVKSIKDIREIFEKKSQPVIEKSQPVFKKSQTSNNATTITRIDRTKPIDSKLVETSPENAPQHEASPIPKDIAQEVAITQQNQDSDHQSSDNQESVQSSDEDDQVNVFEIRLKFENKIQASKVPKKTYKKPVVKSRLSSTKSLPNLMGACRYDEEAPFLNSTDSVNEFVLQFKEKREFWDRLVENSSCSSLNSSISDVAYQNALKTKPEHKNEMSQSHSCLYSGEFESIDEEKGEDEDLKPKDFHGSSTNVLDRIRVFEKDFDTQKCTTALKKVKQKSQRSLMSTSFNSIKNTQELSDIPLTDQHVEENLYFAEEMKKRFESARTFFRSMERIDSSNPRNSKLQRHYSCEGRETIEKDLPKRSESMRNLNVLDRFSLDNLYRDVMKSKMQQNGSFRGSPNKSAVADTLASMSSTESGLEKDFRDDDDLDLSYFNAKRRTKQRKSIKSVFEVNY